MIEGLKPEDVDILVLPEMAFTGYVFKDKGHIRPYLEDAETGPSVRWAKTQAVRLNARVQVGYPERRVIHKDGQVHEEFYNSVCFVSPQGDLLATYAKHFLYYTDESWAEEGPGFQSIPVEGLGQVGFGICMDVNPYQFKTPFTDFEFANFHLKQGSNLVLCSMAWNKGEEEEKIQPKQKSINPLFENEDSANNGGYSHDDDDEDWEDEEDEEQLALELQHKTVQYWALRMSPFYGSHKPSKGAYIVVANRVGLESGALFVGSSCVLKLSASGPELVGVLPSHGEGVLQVEI
ncbi:Carbon-nitrogen hydrolase [Dissophora ornata]|nr:Carbon-nitrogen hydrolase [Dissophora ornata]